MKDKKMLFINLLSSVLAFTINIAIAFFLTPFIVKTLGIEAYGFITLGTNFINYLTLITIALNSMAGRFISIEIHRGNWEQANKYFTSVILANIFVTLVLIVPSVLFILFIEKFINIPVELLSDVKVLFTLLFLSFFISIIFSSHSVATFATNKLYLNSLRNIESNIIKGLLLLLLFNLFDPAISFMGIVTVIVMIYLSLFNIYYMKKLLPEFNFDKLYFDIKAIFTLIKSGVWNLITRVGQVFLDGFNLLLANILIGATAMGMLSVVNTVPIVMSTLMGTVASVFMPNFTKLYAKNDTKGLLNSIKSSIKILGIVTNIPIACLIVFGEEFFSLWVPSEDAKTLQILSIIILSVWIVSGCINTLYHVFTVTNKLRANALILLLTGVINIPIVLLLFYNTNLGIYSIVIVTAVLGVMRNLFFTIPYSAKYLGLKWYTFYSDVIKSMLVFSLIVVVGIFVKKLINIDSWSMLVMDVLLTAICGILMNMLLIFKEEIKNLLLHFKRV